MKIIDNKIETVKQLKKIAERTNIENNDEINLTVKNILEDIKKNGDTAIKKYTLQFDGFNPEPMGVAFEEIEEAWYSTNSELQEALKNAKNRIEKFHKEQVPKNISLKGIYGECVQRKWLPVNKAGIYIPGGRASYPSTVLMNAIPAQVAGVREIIMVSPGNKEGKINQTVLAAAYITGIRNIFRIGGAQAIGALAFGTKEINKVDVISGPGNIFVTTAKKLIFGSTGIDSLAGPSEILIIADDTANSNQLATDLLAQAEHDPFAAAILLTTSLEKANEVSQKIYQKLENHPRKEICIKSIKDWGLIGICENLETCIELSNKFAPEHLEIITKSPHEILIIADHTANGDQLATDLLAQAEHDPFAAAILLTTSLEKASEVSHKIYQKLENHPRKEICTRSIKDWGLIGICENLETCIELSLSLIHI